MKVAKFFFAVVGVAVKFRSVNLLKSNSKNITRHDNVQH